MKSFWVIPFDFPQALGEFNRKDCKICKGLPNLQDVKIVRSKKMQLMMQLELPYGRAQIVEKLQFMADSYRN